VTPTTATLLSAALTLLGASILVPPLLLALCLFGAPVLVTFLDLTDQADPILPGPEQARNPNPNEPPGV